MSARIRLSLAVCALALVLLAPNSGNVGAAMMPPPRGEAPPGPVHEEDAGAHADVSSVCDFYRTQLGPDNAPEGCWNNCGPASVAMAIQFSRNNQWVSVAEIRQVIIDNAKNAKGEPLYSQDACEGYTLADLEHALKHPGWQVGQEDVNEDPVVVTMDIPEAWGVEGIKGALDEGHICIAGISTSEISQATDATSHYGRFYPDTPQHILVVKGYFHDENGREWLVVHDPYVRPYVEVPEDPELEQAMNPDWYSKDKPKGRDRYYAADEFQAAMEANTPYALEIIPVLDTEDSVDVALIIDSSGSMTWNDPTDLRKQAATAFVATVLDGDRVSIVDFDSGAQTRWPLGCVGGQRASINKAIDAVDSSGGTDIGAGLQMAYEQLSSSAEHHRKAAVLLTDGDGSYFAQAQLFESMAWPVYTIGLGESTNELLLMQIAAETGGMYFHLADPSQLENVYFQIAVCVAEGTMLLEEAQPMTEGTWWDTVLEVLPGLQRLFVFVNWPGSEVSVTLVAPDGRVIGPETSAPDVFHAQGVTYELYRIDEPVPGNWVVKVYAKELDPGGETVSLQVSGVRKPVVPVKIDIGPGEEPNSINCTNPRALVNAAILSTEAFDATTVDHASVTLEGAREVHRRSGTPLPQRHEEDVDGDGKLDLMFHFALGDTWLCCDTARDVILIGQTFDGQLIEGRDAVRMVNPNKDYSFTSRGD